MAFTNSTKPTSKSQATDNQEDKDPEWIIEISDFLVDLENKYDIPPSIFRVPNLVADVKPEAYTPQIIALGPYHHFKPELYELEHQKLAAVKRSMKPKFKISDFDELVKEMDKKVEDIYKYYRGLPDHHHKTFACMMAIDGVFLLDLLHTVYDENQPKSYGIVKDVMKLENQIPMFVLKLIMDNLCYPMEEFYKMLQKFCQEVCPIDLDWRSSVLPPRSDTDSEPLHLLDFLYHGITFEEETSPTSTDESSSDRSVDADGNAGEQIGSANWSKLFSYLSSLKVGGFVVKLFKLISTLFGIIHVPSTSFFKEKKILIPSVSKLYQAGIKFSSADGGTAKTRFDETTMTFHIPVVTLKRTSEVVIRNLVIYETMAKSKTQSLSFRRFIELISAIVVTIEDVQLLKDYQVLIVEDEDAQVPENKAKAHEGHDLSNVEIVEMFDGIDRTMESKDWVIDQAIKKANQCYNQTPKVKAYRLMKKYVYSSWKILTLFASMLLLLLTAVQAVCSIYSCPAIFNTIN